MRLCPVLALLLLGCGNSSRDVELSHPTVGGLELSLRHREARWRTPCQEEGLNIYRCAFIKTEKRGCTYLDVGGARVKHPGDDPCTRTTPERRVLSAIPREIDFEVDAAGARIAWRDNVLWNVAYVFEGQLLVPPLPYRPPNLAIPKSTSAIDWRALKTLDDAAPGLYFDAPVELQPPLLVRIRQSGGDRVVAQMLTDRATDVTNPGWEPAFQSLDAPHRQQVVDAVLRSIFENGDDSALPWLDTHPETHPANLEERLRERAVNWVQVGDSSINDNWLIRAYRRHDPAAPRIACESLEQRALAAQWGENQIPNEFDGVPYAVIAATGSKCPAVTRELGEAACSTALRCVRGLEEGVSQLCDESDLEQLKQALNEDDGKSSYGDFDPAAKMNALRAQGPLSSAFQLKNARRSYQVVRRRDAGVAMDGFSPCTGEPERVSDFLCELRPEQTKVELFGCRVEIDDVKKVVRLTQLDEQDGGR